MNWLRKVVDLCKSDFFNDRLNVVLRLLVGTLFLYSGVSKLIRPIEFFEIAINFYKIVPDALVHPTALVIPWIELFAGAYFLVGLWTKISALVLVVLASAFQLLFAQALVRGIPISDCGCFGHGFFQPTLYQSFALDTLLILLLLRFLEDKKQLFSLDRALT